MIPRNFKNWLPHAFALFAVWLCVGQSVQLRAQEKVTFDDHVKPLFQRRCANCHNSEKQSGGLDLTNYTNMMQGGGSGGSIDPGDAGSSYLYMLVTHEETPVMPPGGNKIPEQEISLIEAWINGGALENKGSIARKRKKIAVSSVAIGTRPDKVAVPPRLSMQPYFRSKQKGATTSMATSPWAPYLAVAVQRQVLLYKTESLQFAGALSFPEGQANAVAFSRSGEILIAGGGRHGLAGKVVGWDVESAERVFELGDEVDNVLAADISVDHSLVALGGPQRMLRVYKTATGELAYEKKKHNDWITKIAFSPDGVLLATADRNGGLQLWEADSGNEYLTLGGHDASITGLSWRADGNVLASCSEDGNARLWEANNGGQIKNWSAHGGGATGIEFSRDGKIVTCGRDRLVKLWQQDGNLIKQFQGLKEIGVAVDYCDETNRIIGASLVGDVQVWSADAEKSLQALNINPLTIEQRVAQSQKRLEESRSKLVPVEKEFKKINADFVARQLQFKQLDSQLGAVKEVIAEKIQELDAQKALVDSDAAQRQSWAEELESLEAAMPIVSEAKDKATEAANLLPENVGLKETAGKLVKEYATLVSQSEELSIQITNSENSAQGKSELLAALEKTCEDCKQSETTVGEEVEAARARFAVAEDKKKEFDPKLADARKTVAQAESRLNFWLAERAFHQKLVFAKEKLAHAQERVDQQDANVVTAETKLSQAQAEYDRQVGEKQKLQQAVDQVESALRELQKRQ